MKKSDFRARVEESPVVWLLGTLFVGACTGVSLMLGLQTYCGMVMVTKGEYEELVAWAEEDRCRTEGSAAAPNADVGTNASAGDVPAKSVGVLPGAGAPGQSARIARLRGR